MTTSKQRLCSECYKKRERCRAANILPDGTIEYVCPQCWRVLGYDEFLYKHRLGEDITQAEK